jgi:sugar lactone lactonase YvrE
VTADREAHVVAVELATGRMVRRIPTLEGPRSIQSVFATRSVVAHTAEGAVTLLDGLEKRRVLRGFQEPRYTAMGPDGKQAYVTDSKSGEVAVLELDTGRVVHRTEVGALARHVTADPLGRTLWVALGFSARTIVVLDLADPVRPRVIRRISPPFPAHDVAFEPRGRQVWVSAGEDRLLAVYEPSGHLQATTRADAPPQHVTFAAGRAFVASGDSGLVRVHALHDGGLVRTSPVPAGSYNVQSGLGAVVTPSLDEGTLVVLDRFGRNLRELRVAASSHDAALVTTA